MAAIWCEVIVRKFYGGDSVIYVDVQMNNGKIFRGEKVEELAKFIIDKFSQEKLSCDEAKIALDRTKSIIGEYSLVQSMD